MDEKTRKKVDEITKKLMKEGKLIEAGWITLLLTLIPPTANKEQINAMKLAFYLGCQHLYSSLVTGLDEDKEPTEEDMKKMELIHKELDVFDKELKAFLKSRSN
jgi:hypothetical protein